MMKYMEKHGDLTFDKIFNQRLGFLLFKDYCLNFHEEPVPQIRFYEEIKKLESLETDEERIALGKEIYDQFIMKDLLSQSHVSPMPLLFLSLLKCKICFNTIWGYFRPLLGNKRALRHQIWPA